MIKIGDRVKLLTDIFGVVDTVPRGTEGEVVADPNPAYYLVKWDGYGGAWTMHPASVSPVSGFYWTHAPTAPVRNWSPGDRVRREGVKDSPNGIPPGTEGLVTEITEELIHINWDGYGLHSYDLPLRHPLFSKINPLQSPKPVLCCTRCGEFNEYAEANQADGTHKCFLCRTYKYR